MSRPTIALVTLAVCTGGVTVVDGSAAADAVPGQLVVGFTKGTDSSKQKQLIEHAGGRLVRRLAHIRGTVVRVRAQGLALRTLRGRLIDAHPVRYAEPDYYLHASAQPNDPFYAEQYSLAATGPGAVAAPQAWNSDTSCSKVAVLDTGTQNSHPDLKGNVWHNKNETNNNNKDDDHNGYVDDYYGINLVAHNNQGSDDEGHGTHVSGIIAGRGNNGVGVSGLCWTGSVMPVKFMDSKGRGSSSAAAEALDYAVMMGAKVVNGSFGSSSKSTALADAVEYAQTKNVLLVFAAGNDGTNNDKAPIYPASLTRSNIITVAAVTASGELASFSNYGPKSVDLGAPGMSIVSTFLNSTYKTLSGTSMAAPIVAAAAAMIRSQDSDLTYSEIRSAILSHTAADGALSGKTAKAGVLDVAAALASVK